MRKAGRENLMLAGLAFMGLAVNILVALANRGSWATDFNQYYAAGQLVGSGKLYDWESLRNLELRHSANVVTFTRIPAFALAFKPVSALPWEAARVLWFSIGIAALAGFVALWPGIDRGRAVTVICWSMPAMLCLETGQDSMVFLFFAALGLKLLVDRRDFLAGLAFSACIAKPHLAVLVPVLVMAQKRWMALAGGATGVAAGVGLCFLSGEGRDWPQRLIALTSQIDGHPLLTGLARGNLPPAEAPIRMPNLRGLLSFFGASIGVEAAIGALVVVAAWYICRSQRVAVAGAIVLGGGLLIGHHAYMYDALLLIPALLMPFETGWHDWIRFWAVFLVTPIAYYWILSDFSLELPGHIALSGYMLALIGITAWRARASGWRPYPRREMTQRPQLPASM